MKLLTVAQVDKYAKDCHPNNLPFWYEWTEWYTEWYYTDRIIWCEEKKMYMSEERERKVTSQKGVAAMNEMLKLALSPNALVKVTDSDLYVETNTSKYRIRRDIIVDHFLTPILELL